MSESFTILTYNVANGRADPARLVRMLRSAGADVIGLQELAHVQAEVIEAELAEEYPYRATFAGGFHGKAILSRFPILRTEQLQLSDVRPDLLASLDLEGRELAVISAHPPPPRPSPLKLRFDANTQAQIRSLAGLANQHAPAVLLGDFNMTDTHAEYAYMTSTGLQDAFKASGRGRGSTLPRRIGPWKRNLWLNGLIRWVPLMPLFRIDFIWHTSQLRSLDCWVGTDAGSDHLPVLAVLAFAG
jgi:endonuclease/exonuclease/phosphatase family metal-dependent hydrolase